MTVSAVLAAAVGTAWLTAGVDEPDLVASGVPAGAASASPARRPDTRPALTASAWLDARYAACAIAAGFDPGGVQVLLWISGEDGEDGPDGADEPEVGRPWWVKTGRDVPAPIHRRCLVSIGGADPHRSSHGTPAG